MTDTATEQPVPVEDLQAEISKSLTDLAALADLVHQLVDSHQRGLGFLTAEGRKILDAQLLADRKFRRTQPDRFDDDGRLVLGLDFLNRDTMVAGTGHVATAATISALSVDAEILFTLHHLIRRVTKALERAGLCTLHRLPAEPPRNQLLAHLRKLCWDAPSRSLLTEVQRDLDQLHEAANLVIDGNDRTAMDDPCPHCGRKTLVVYFRKGLIRCDRDPRTGHFQVCRCPDSYCDCKQKPVSFRHSWWRAARLAPNPRTAHDWHDLAGRLNHNRTKETCP